MTVSWAEGILQNWVTFQVKERKEDNVWEQF